MFNRNAFKTSIMFLAIIFIGVVVRAFVLEKSILVGSDTEPNTTIACVFKGSC